VTNRFPDFVTTDPAHADVFNEKVIVPANALDSEVQEHVSSPVLSAAGIHGLRITEGGIVEFYDGEAWLSVQRDVDGGSP
jgi:hypothetical protein